jgi:hypothetical protein
MMNENPFVGYANATSTFLSFGGLCIESVWCERVDDCLEKIMLKFETEALVIKAVADDDSVQLFRVPNGELAQLLQHAEPPPCVFAKYVGQEFGWGWIAVNQQNYLDGVLLSFNGIVPNLLLNVIASSLHVFEVCDANDLRG